MQNELCFCAFTTGCFLTFSNFIAPAVFAATGVHHSLVALFTGAYIGAAAWGQVLANALWPSIRDLKLGTALMLCQVLPALLTAYQAVGRLGPYGLIAVRLAASACTANTSFTRVAFLSCSRKRTKQHMLTMSLLFGMIVPASVALAQLRPGDAVPLRLSSIECAVLLLVGAVLVWRGESTLITPPKPHRTVQPNVRNYAVMYALQGVVLSLTFGTDSLIAMILHVSEISTTTGSLAMLVSNSIALLVCALPPRTARLEQLGIAAGVLCLGVALATLSRWTLTAILLRGAGYGLQQSCVVLWINRCVAGDQHMAQLIGISFSISGLSAAFAPTCLGAVWSYLDASGRDPRWTVYIAIMGCPAALALLAHQSRRRRQLHLV